jgi:hypothetical protein
MVRQGICVSGKMTIRSNDGVEATISGGDVFVLEPGHDAWTLGEEPSGGARASGGVGNQARVAASLGYLILANQPTPSLVDTH